LQLGLRISGMAFRRKCWHYKYRRGIIIISSIINIITTIKCLEMTFKTHP